MTNLREVNFGMNQYCGPAVLSSLTGESTDRCAAVISAISGKKEIKAVQRTHLMEAFKRLRFDVKKTDFVGSTLYGTLYRMRTAPGLYVLFVPHHVVAVEVTSENEIYICDNHSKTPLDIKQSARLIQRVEEVWSVKKGEVPKFIRSEIRIKKMLRNRIEISKYNHYEKKEDDNEMYLGFLQFEYKLELHEIIKKLFEQEDEL